MTYVCINGNMLPTVKTCTSALFLVASVFVFFQFNYSSQTIEAIVTNSTSGVATTVALFFSDRVNC